MADSEKKSMECEEFQRLMLEKLEAMVISLQHLEKMIIGKNAKNRQKANSDDDNSDNG